MWNSDGNECAIFWLPVRLSDRWASDTKKVSKLTNSIKQRISYFKHYVSFGKGRYYDRVERCRKPGTKEHPLNSKLGVKYSTRLEHRLPYFQMILYLIIDYVQLLAIQNVGSKWWMVQNQQTYLLEGFFDWSKTSQNSNIDNRHPSGPTDSLVPIYMTKKWQFFEKYFNWNVVHRITIVKCFTSVYGGWWYRYNQFLSWHYHQSVVKTHLGQHSTHQDTRPSNS